MQRLRLGLVALSLVLTLMGCDSKDRDFGVGMEVPDGGEPQLDVEVLGQGAATDADAGIAAPEVGMVDDSGQGTRAGASGDTDVDGGGPSTEEPEPTDSQGGNPEASGGEGSEEGPQSEAGAGTDDGLATDVGEVDEPLANDMPKLESVRLVLSTTTLLSLEDSATFEVQCTFDDDTVRACPEEAVISIATAGVVSLSEGVFTPITNGETTVTAAVAGVVSPPERLVVDLGPICTQLNVTGPTSAAAGTSVRWAASCDYDDGRSGVDVTAVVDWESSAETVASVAQSGVLEAQEVGATAITVSIPNPDMTTTSTERGFAVTDGQLVAISITPNTLQQVPSGLTQAFTAECRYTDVSITCTSNVAWMTSDASIAAIANDGVATGRQVGETNVWASLEGVDSPSVVLAVTEPILTRIEVTPNPALSLEVNTWRQLTATCVMSDGSSSACSSGVTWQSSSPEVASVDDEGSLFGQDDGISLVSASQKGVESSPVTVTVTPPDGCGGAISFPDPSLLADVRFYTDKPSGPIYYEDVKSIAYFEHRTINGPVSDLSGLRCFTGLTSLAVEESPLDDMTELIGLLRLERLSLRWTNLSLVPNLSLMSNLASLDLTGTAITDLYDIVLSESIGAGDIVNVQNTNLNCEDTWILDQIQELVDRGVTVYSFCSI